MLRQDQALSLQTSASLGKRQLESGSHDQQTVEHKEIVNRIMYARTPLTTIALVPQ